MTLTEASEILDVSPGVSPVGVREAYLDLVKAWHPDRFIGDPRLEAKAEEKLKQINAAYDDSRH